MKPNVKKYRPFVEMYDLSEDQKVELIHTVWRVVEGFAYRAFELDPVQQAIGPAYGKDALSDSPMLDFEKAPHHDNPLTETFRLKARMRRRKKK